MIDCSRREAIGAASLASLMLVTPGVALAEPEESSVPTSWDLSPLYSSDDAWNAERLEVMERASKLGRHQGLLATGPDALATYLTERSDTYRAAGRVATYASLKADANSADDLARQQSVQANEMLAALGQSTAWNEPEILAIDEGMISHYIRQHQTLRYRFDTYLAALRRNAVHTLSKEDERTLAAATSQLSSFASVSDVLRRSGPRWSTMKTADGTELVVDPSGYSAMRGSAVRTDRETAIRLYWDAYADLEAAFAATYNGFVAGKMAEARARRHSDVLAYAMWREDLPASVYQTMTSETEAGLPVVHRYMELRKRLLKVDRLAFYDIYVPLARIDKRFSLSEMRDVMVAALAPLGPSYQKTFAKASTARWMDALPRRNKARANYTNSSAYDVHPLFTDEPGPELCRPEPVCARMGACHARYFCVPGATVRKGAADQHRCRDRLDDARASGAS